MQSSDLLVNDMFTYYCTFTTRHLLPTYLHSYPSIIHKCVRVKACIGGGAAAERIIVFAFHVSRPVTRRQPRGVAGRGERNLTISVGSIERATEVVRVYPS